VFVSNVAQPRDVHFDLLVPPLRSASGLVWRKSDRRDAAAEPLYLSGAAVDKQSTSGDEAAFVRSEERGPIGTLPGFANHGANRVKTKS
jgi:hypothetical protein